MSTDALPPLPRPPAGFDPRQCECRWCWLWGWVGPMPPNTPTARNPAPRDTPPPKAPPPPKKPVAPTLFDHLPDPGESPDDQGQTEARLGQAEE